MLVAAVLRAGLSGLVPTLPDETCYWDWSRQLDAGYFDQPPGIAFRIAAGTRLLGNTPRYCARDAPPDAHARSRRSRSIGWSVHGKSPLQHGFDFVLWTRAVKQALITDLVALSLSLASIGALLARLDLTVQKP